MQTKKTPSNGVLKITLLVAASMTVMSGATIAPSLPQIQAVFATQPNAPLLTRLVLTIPGLFIAAISPLTGWIVDRFGRKPLLLGSLVLYGFAGTSGYYLDSLYSIIIGRAFLGIAVAGIMTTTSTLVADYFAGEERNRFTGLQGMFTAIGGIIFISLGGFLADIHWRMPFLVYLLAFVVIPAVLLVLYEPTRFTRDKNAPKAILSGNTKKWMAINYGAAFLGMAIFYMIPVQIPFILNEMGNVSNAQIGQAIASGMVAGALVSFNYSRLRKWLNFTQVYIVIFLMMALGYAVVWQAQSYFHIIVGMVANGLGFGMLMPNTSLCLMAMAPLELRGRILSGVNSFIFIGQFVSPIMVQPIANQIGLQASFAVFALVMVGIALFFGGLYWQDRYRPSVQKA